MAPGIRIASTAVVEGRDNGSDEQGALPSNQNLAGTALSIDDTEERLRDSLVAWGELRKLSREMGTFVLSARLARKRTSSSEQDKAKRQRMDTADATTSATVGHHPPSESGFSQQHQARLKKMVDVFVVMQRAQEAFEQEIKTTLQDWKEQDEVVCKTDSKQDKNDGAKNHC